MVERDELVERVGAARDVLWEAIGRYTVRDTVVGELLDTYEAAVRADERAKAQVAIADADIVNPSEFYRARRRYIDSGEAKAHGPLGGFEAGWDARSEVTPEMVEAASRAYVDELGGAGTWDELREETRAGELRCMRAALTAALQGAHE